MPNGNRALTDISLRPARIGAGAAIALVWVIVGVTFLIDPTILQRSQVGGTVAPWDYVWNTLYIIGGIAILAGRWQDRHVLGAEILGVCLLAAGWAINALAVIYVQGLELRALTYVVFIWWAYSRYRHLQGRA